MALIRYNRYPGRFASATTDYPQGAFKNKSGPTSEDGSYAEADWLNDWDGFFGRLMTQAGMSANGTVDSASSSQYYDALASLFPLASLFTGNLSDTGHAVIPLTINGKIQKLIINWSTWSGTTSSTSTSNIYEFTTPVIVTWDKPFPNKLLSILPSVQDTSTNFAKNETVRYWTPSLSTVGLLGSCDTASVVIKGYVIAIGY